LYAGGADVAIVHPGSDLGDRYWSSGITTSGYGL